MPKWIPFTPEEQKKLASQGLTLTQTGEMRCSHCENRTMRIYLHDLSERKTAEWLWCADCKRFAHHCIAAPSDRCSYNDPLNSPGYQDKLRLSGDKWYDFLNELYESGVLPQDIRRK